MPKIVDHDEYRKELLSRCFELFSTTGYANVTMRQIARELGVSTGTLYHYFPTKHSIFTQLFAQERASDVSQALAQIEDTRDLGDRIDGFIDHWQDKREYYQNILLLAVDFFRSVDPGSGNETLIEFSEYYRTNMASGLDVPEPIASMLFIFVIGLMYHTPLSDESVSFLGQLRLVKAMVLAFMEKVENEGVDIEMLAR